MAVEFPEPDLSVVEYLVREMAAGWCDVAQHHPEADLDAWLQGCTVAASQPAIVNHATQLRVDRCDIDGVEQAGSLWDHISRCKADENVHAYGLLDITPILLIVHGRIHNGSFDCECVYKGRGEAFEPGDEVFCSRVADWCQRVVSLGAVLGANAVTVPGRQDATPIVLWRRP